MARIDSPYFLTQTRPLRPMGRKKEPKRFGGVDKTNLAIAQVEPWRDPDYLVWIRALPSAVSGKSPCVAAHVRIGWNWGAEKPHDHWAVPLTDEEHKAQHAMSEKRFWQEHGIDVLLLRAWLYEVWLAGGDLDAAAAVISKCRRAE